MYTLHALSKVSSTFCLRYGRPTTLQMQCQITPTDHAQSGHREYASLTPVGVSRMWLDIEMIDTNAPSAQPTAREGYLQASAYDRCPASTLGADRASNLRFSKCSN